ncbi:tumor necrosis factor receptor superfamily member 11B-like isoform X2 [Narcine bancroftii]
MCPPGKYKVNSNTNENQPNCAPCKDETYTEKENTLPECRRCYGPCIGGSVQKVPCSRTTNRKCECPFHHYCATEDVTNCEFCKKCDITNGPPKGIEEHFRQACQPCSSGTFLNISYALKCQPHTNCTALGMILRIKGNSTVDNYCVVNSVENSSQINITSSFRAYPLWIIIILCTLCVVALISSRIKPSHKREIGMLKKLRFICICDMESTFGKSGGNDEETKLKAVPETGGRVDGSISYSKPRMLIVLQSANGAESPTIEYRSEILDIETMSGIGSIEDNIPFPVQENGRNSNTNYPTEEQNNKTFLSACKDRAYN